MILGRDPVLSYKGKKCLRGMHLQVVSEVLVCQGCGLEAICSLLGSKPGPPLALRVYEKGVASGASHQNAILDAELIGGKPLCSNSVKLAKQLSSSLQLPLPDMLLVYACDCRTHC